MPRIGPFLFFIGTGNPTGCPTHIAPLGSPKTSVVRHKVLERIRNLSAGPEIVSRASLAIEILNVETTSVHTSKFARCPESWRICEAVDDGYIFLLSLPQPEPASPTPTFFQSEFRFRS